MTPASQPSLLKLRAQDADDVMIVSAVLQDSIAPVCDMIYRPEEKNFIMVVHRLRREDKESSCPERICCAVNLRGVEAAQIHGIDLKNAEQMLDLLAILPDEKTIQFIFAGEAKIRAQLGEWSMIVEDFGEPWPASCTPCHDGEDKHLKTGLQAAART